MIEEEEVFVKYMKVLCSAVVNYGTRWYNINQKTGMKENNAWGH